MHSSPQFMTHPPPCPPTDYLSLQPGEALLAAVGRRCGAFNLVELAMFVRKLEQATSSASMTSAAGVAEPWIVGLKKTAKRMFSAKA